MTSDPQTEIENTNHQASILCGSLRDLTSFLSSKTHWVILENIHIPLCTTLNWVPKNFKRKYSGSLCRIANPADS